MKRRSLIKSIGASGVLIPFYTLNTKAINTDIVVQNKYDLPENWSDPKIRLQFSKFVIETRNIRDNTEISMNIDAGLQENDLKPVNNTPITVTLTGDNSYIDVSSHIPTLDLTDSDSVFIDNSLQKSDSIVIDLQVKINYENKIYKTDIKSLYIDIVESQDTITNGYYIDDFSDNKLLDRDTYSETVLNPLNLEPDSSAYSNPVRPEWTQEVSNGISINDTDITLSGNTDYVMHASFSDLNIFNKKTVWEFKFRPSGTSNGADRYTLVGMGNPTNYVNNNNGNNETYFNTENYQIFANDGGTKVFRFGRQDSGDGKWPNTLLDMGSLSANKTYVCRVERSIDGIWEVFLNGISQGTVEDTTYTQGNIYTGIAGDSRGSVNVYNYRIY